MKPSASSCWMGCCRLLDICVVRTLVVTMARSWVWRTSPLALCLNFGSRQLQWVWGAFGWRWVTMTWPPVLTAKCGGMALCLGIQLVRQRTCVRRSPIRMLQPKEAVRAPVRTVVTTPAVRSLLTTRLLTVKGRRARRTGGARRPRRGLCLSRAPRNRTTRAINLFETHVLPM